MSFSTSGGWGVTVTRAGMRAGLLRTTTFRLAGEVGNTK